MSELMRYTLILSLLSGSFACSHSATITRLGAHPVEGVIISCIAVPPAATLAATESVDTWIKGPLAIRRTAILDIDHPGNVLATIGGLYGGMYGLILLMFWAAPQEGDASKQELTAFLGPIALSGLAMAGWGLYAWGGSVMATQPARPALSVLPSLQRDAHGATAPSLHLSLTW